MAARLFITVSTARIHLKNIYRKLDIHSRLQAVERARALNLLYMPLGVKHVSANVK